MSDNGEITFNTNINIDRDTLFKAGLENSILSSKDVQTYQLTKNHSITRLSRIFNDNKEVYVKEEYLKPFSKRATFYINTCIYS